MTDDTVSLNPEEEPDGKPSFKVALGAAAQISLAAIAPLILLPLLVLELAQESGAIESRVIVVSIVVCGLITLLSTSRVGPLRSNSLYIAVMDPMSIPFCILALDGGGFTTLAILVIISGLFQILVGMRLASLRRIITPHFTATILILSCISAVPVFLRATGGVPEGRSPFAIPACILVTAVSIFFIKRLVPTNMKLWAAPMGLAMGAIVALFYGIYRVDTIREAAWIGLPTEGWHILGAEIDSSLFNGAFFSLLSSFLIFSLVQVVRTNTSSLIAQVVSHQDMLVFDFREVQRVNSRIGLGSILSGLGGSMPLRYSPLGTSVIMQTRCDARQLGALVGGFFLVAAVVPKFQAILIAIPRAMIGVYFVFLLLPLIAKLAWIPLRSAKDRGVAAMMLIPIAVGFIFGLKLIPFPSGAAWSAVPQTGLATGTVVLLALTMLHARRSNRHKMDLELNSSSITTVQDFVTQLASRHSWNTNTQRNLDAVAEEALSVLTQRYESSETSKSRRICIVASITGSTVELEFLSAPTDAQNLEERLALLKDPEAEALETTIEHDAPLRLLSHYATAVNHRQYQQAEIITATVAVE